MVGNSLDTKAWSGAVHTRLDTELPQLLQSQQDSGWKSPVITLKWNVITLWECELFFSAWCVFPSMFDSEKNTSKSFMGHLSCKPIWRHRILLL